MVELVLGQGGSLKAEHGTGRMMAPYVRRQYGDELYEVMREIKRLCDPARPAQPGRADQRRPRRPHPPPQGRPDRRGGGRPLRGMRLLRAGLPEPGPHHHTAAADRAAPRDAAAPRPAATPRCCASSRRSTSTTRIDTCAVDGMCQTACPVLINTGDLIKRLRADNAGKPAPKGWACRRASTGRAPPAPRPRRLTVGRELPGAAGHRCRTAGPQGDRPRHVAAVVAGAARRRRRRPRREPAAPTRR